MSWTIQFCPRPGDINMRWPPVVPKSEITECLAFRLHIHVFWLAFKNELALAAVISEPVNRSYSRFVISAFTLVHCVVWRKMSPNVPKRAIFFPFLRAALTASTPSHQKRKKSPSLGSREGGAQQMTPQSVVLPPRCAQ